MIAQTTDTVLMIRPAAFRSNPGTLESNAFQHPPADDPAVISQLARAEFDTLAGVLREAGVNVIVAEDTPSPIKPDAVYPNNWFTTHEDGRVALYPMMAPQRRTERRPEMLEHVLGEHGFDLRILDSWLVRAFESKGQFLEGTGSMVLDRANRTAYACRSPRTDRAVFESFCSRYDYRAVLFEATDQDDQAYYHTNVMMGIGADFAVICAESIAEHDRDRVLGSLRETGHELVSISCDQAMFFCGNVLELRSRTGERLLAMSSTTHAALTPDQTAFLESRGLRLVHAPIPTIERQGGGGVRCMLAEVFLPRVR